MNCIGSFKRAGGKQIQLAGESGDAVEEKAQMRRQNLKVNMKMKQLEIEKFPAASASLPRQRSIDCLQNVASASVTQRSECYQAQIHCVSVRAVSSTLLLFSNSK